MRKLASILTALGCVLLAVLGVLVARVFRTSERMVSSPTFQMTNESRVAEGRPSPSETTRDGGRRAKNTGGEVDTVGTRSARTGKLLGRVVLDDGSSVPGALVMGLHVMPDFVGPIDGLEVKGALLNRRVEAVTDDRGAFELGDFPTGRILLGVRHRDLAPLDLDFFHQRDEAPHDLGVITVSRGVVLAGWVQNPDGLSVPGAQLFLCVGGKDGPLAGLTQSPRASAFLARTDNNGYFQSTPLPVGSWRLVVVAPGYPKLEVDGESWSPGLSPGLIFVLKAPPGLSGIVLADDGYILTDLNVEAVDVGPLPGRGRKWSTTCDTNGRFVFLELTAERDRPLNMLIRHQRGWLEMLEIPVTALANQEDLVLTLQPSSWLLFGVRDKETGQPLTEPQITLHHWAGIAVSQRTDLTDRLLPVGQPGRYRLRLSPSRLALGVAISASDGEYTTYYKKPLELFPGEKADLGWLHLQKRRTLQVRVIAASTGELLREAIVYAVREDKVGQSHDEATLRVRNGQNDFEFSDHRTTWVTGEMGSCDVSYDESHSWLLVGSHPEYAPGQPKLIPAGHNGDPIELRLLRGASVRVTIRSEGRPLTRMPVHLEYKYLDERSTIINPDGFGSGQRAAQTDEKGQCLFHNVLLGDHCLWVDGQRIDPPVHLSTDAGIHELLIDLP